MAELSAVRSVVREVNFLVHGLPATVFPAPPGDRIDTRIIWLDETIADYPGGQSFSRREGRKVLALRRDQVPEVPHGLRLAAPEYAGGPVLGWIVDGIDRTSFDHARVVVLPDPEYVP